MSYNSQIDRLNRARAIWDAMPTIIVVARYVGGDVYEMPVKAHTVAKAHSRFLAHLGFDRADVVFCQA